MIIREKMGRIKVYWTAPHKISDQYRIDALFKYKKYIKGKLLDIGCGVKPYQDILGESTDSWIGADLPYNFNGKTFADVYCRGEFLPFKNETIDTVFSTEALTHIPEPCLFFSESKRILKKGGILMLTCRQTGPIVEIPNDYYRFTSYGLKYLAEKNGLNIIHLDTFGGAFAVAGEHLSNHIYLIRKPLWLGKLLRLLLRIAVQFIFLALDRIFHVDDVSTIGYIIIATKQK